MQAFMLELEKENQDVNVSYNFIQKSTLILFHINCLWIFKSGDRQVCR